MGPGFSARVQIALATFFTVFKEKNTPMHQEVRPCRSSHHFQVGTCSVEVDSCHPELLKTMILSIRTRHLDVCRSVGSAEWILPLSQDRRSQSSSSKNSKSLLLRLSLKAHSDLLVIILSLQTTTKKLGMFPIILVYQKRKIFGELQKVLASLSISSCV